MKPSKRIVDTTLRDGEQSPDASFSRWQKIRIASVLDYAGVSQIEAGAPSIGAYEKETISMIIDRGKSAKYSVWSRLNADDIKCCLDCRPDIVHISVPVSYVHIYSKLRKNKNWVLNHLSECLNILASSSATVSVGLEDAFRSDISFLITICRLLANSNVTRIRLADTVGIATPQTCRDMILSLSEHLEGSVELGYHAHNDLGMALATTIEALKTRCVYADATILGIGERSGNCDLFKLIKTTASIFDWGITAAAAKNAQDLFCDIVSPIGRNQGESAQPAVFPKEFHLKRRID
ncbi:MAG: homocitrate synthase [Clostridiales bacterium]|jgi:homocitrate synthase NifV|nr:homocitrate synthase [Clostridiales bacterium]